MNEKVSVDEEKKRSWLVAVPPWLWRLLAGLILAGATAWWCIPFAMTQRGGTGFGGEYGLIIAAFALPFCVLRGSF